MKLKLVIFLLIISSVGTFGQQQDKLLQLLKSELQYNLSELKKQDQPPYYMSMRVADTYDLYLESSFGTLSACNETEVRLLVPQIRLGSPELDNFKYVSQGLSSSMRQPLSRLLPFEDEFTDAIREAIWRETLARYRFACKQYDQAKAKATVSVEDENKSPCFSAAPTASYYEAPLPADRQRVDVETWKKRLDEISAVFNGRIPTLKAPSSTGSARFMLEPTSLTMVPSFGTVHISADKGMSPEKLKKELLKAAKAEGLEYAYIVRRIGRENSLIYRVNVKDGKETQMRVMQMEVPDPAKLTELKGISSKEEVKNYMQNNCPVSVIYPSGIIIGNIEINRPTPKSEKAPVIPAPLQRK